MMSRFCRYIDKIFDFRSRLSGLTDSRKKPQLSPQAAFLSAFFLFSTGRKSLTAMETELRIPKRFDELIGPNKPGADSMGRILSVMDNGPLRHMLYGCHRQLKRNKVVQTDWPIRFAAVDGHEFFSLRASSLRRLLRTHNPHEERR